MPAAIRLQNKAVELFDTLPTHLTSEFAALMHPKNLELNLLLESSWCLKRVVFSVATKTASF